MEHTSAIKQSRHYTYRKRDDLSMVLCIPLLKDSSFPYEIAFVTERHPDKKTTIFIATLNPQIAVLPSKEFEVQDEMIHFMLQLYFNILPQAMTWLMKNAKQNVSSLIPPKWSYMTCARCKEGRLVAPKAEEISYNLVNKIVPTWVKKTAKS